MANILRFLNKLRADKCGPSGELTKLSTLKTALNMMVSRIPEDSTDEEDRALILRAKVVETRINGIQKTIRKEANAISAQKREFFIGEKVDRGTVIQFLGNERLLQLVKSYIAKEKMTEEIHNLVTAYICHHRPTPQKEAEKYVFLTPSGKQVIDIPSLIPASTCF